MEPIITYSGLELTLAELILAAAILLLGALIAMFFARRGGSKVDEQLAEMGARQAELQGRLAQFAQDAAQRDTMFRESLDTRLSQVGERVGKSISDTQDRNSESMKQLHERLALIDRAQKNIETLSGEVSGLQSLLSNKQSRGAFGEKQMQDLIQTYLPPSSYTFQATLSNGKRVDALVHLPNDQGNVAIDSKFPMEAWRRLTDADNSPEETSAQKAFARDVLFHIKSIADKYIIHGETHETAMLFLPSEAVYGELHANFPQVIDKSFAQKVMVVSPTTFMATLHTMRAVMKDAAMREQAHVIQKEVSVLSGDVKRLADRAEKLQIHFRQAGEDVTGILTSSRKISNRAKRIESIDVPEEQEPDLLDEI